MDKTLVITEEMYLGAKAIVAAYEKPEFDSEYDKTDAEMKAKYMDPDKPCCNLVHLFIENEKAGLYVRDLFKKYPKNPKLEYRKTGEIDKDKNSREPLYCDYNALREMIRVAKMHGNDHAHFRTSIATASELVKDGYEDHNNKYNGLITWKKSGWFGK